MARLRAAIVLAAGTSTRMGASKALLPWDRTTLVGYAVRELHAAGATRIVVVVGADAEQVLAALPDASDVVPVVNGAYAAGRSSSIRAGVAAIPPECGALLVQSVDQPCPADILRALYEAAEQDGVDVAVPVFGGRRGHPICLSGRLVPELAEVREQDQGLRAVVRRHAGARREVPVESDVVHLNLNDQAAYAAAIRGESRQACPEESRASEGRKTGDGSART
jgi:molybdenum cofactor cytidylyltransferase